MWALFFALQNKQNNTPCHSSFIVAKRTITGIIYLDMLQQFMLPKTADIEHKSGQCVIFMQDARFITFLQRPTL